MGEEHITDPTDHDPNPQPDAPPCVTSRPDRWLSSPACAPRLPAPTLPYRDCSNQGMMSYVLRALVDKYDLAGQRLGDVSLGAVIKHSRDFNLARESTLSSGLDPQTPAFDIPSAPALPACPPQC